MSAARFGRDMAPKGTVSRSLPPPTGPYDAVWARLLAVPNPATVPNLRTDRRGNLTAAARKAALARMEDPRWRPILAVASNPRKPLPHGMRYTRTQGAP